MDAPRRERRPSQNQYQAHNNSQNQSQAERSRIAGTSSENNNYPQAQDSYPQDVPFYSQVSGNQQYQEPHRRNNQSNLPAHQDYYYNHDGDMELVSANSTTPFASDLKLGYDSDQRLFKFIPLHYQEKIDKYLCCCVPRNRKRKIICLSVTAGILLLLGILLYFVIPRMPDTSVIGVQLRSFTASYPNDKNDINQIRIQGEFLMDISAWNPNWYGLTIDSLYVDVHVRQNATLDNPRYNYVLAQLVGDKGRAAVGKPPLLDSKPEGYNPQNNSYIGFAKTSGLFFAPNAFTNFSMTFYLDYTPDQYVGVLYDRTVLELASACGITSKSGKKFMGITHNAKATIPFLSSLGIYPVMTNDRGGLSCPVDITSEKIADFDLNIANGMSVSEALKSFIPTKDSN
ncbi:hypothetical protein BCR33DRAFT_846330 [Rhizoclosmatium globosum]|uniref:Uncharacterized protein n=1 Tax=Rhizoclosmatium globosum TaxID=329046 RepID=A0A1Y2CX07_9FUNG|nr:hypothetical protein BCR33DRAFT_846330 [Rhizoclosmatium globosum]|eukprot:ORY51563.1 hypothetical protein BCR33DRAFT_846330 [Rhizoclosmatium globosum]